MYNDSKIHHVRLGQSVGSWGVAALWPRRRLLGIAWSGLRAWPPPGHCPPPPHPPPPFDEAGRIVWALPTWHCVFGESGEGDRDWAGDFGGGVTLQIGGGVQGGQGMLWCSCSLYLLSLPVGLVVAVRRLGKDGIRRDLEKAGPKARDIGVGGRHCFGGRMMGGGVAGGVLGGAGGHIS